MGRHRNDRGSATPLTLIVIAVAVVTMAAAGRTGGALVQRQRAQAAADAAALALAATDGDLGRARHVASANGATLESVRDDGASVVVTVRVGDQRATARARRGQPWARALTQPGSLHSTR